MSKKTDRAAHGPSWTEVILGAVLSLGLGVVLGAALLILRPVVIQKSEPKERERGVVYYVEGSRDTSKARQADAKRKAFVGGQSVSVTEEEINSLIAPGGGAPAAPPKAPTKKAAEKDKEGKDAEKGADAGASGGYFTAGAPVVRIHEGALEVGAPIVVGLIDQRIFAQARGGFVKQGDIFVYEPETLYLGSCPVQRLPFVADYVRDKFLAGQPIPDDLKAAWSKLANVTIEGKALKLTMP